MLITGYPKSGNTWFSLMMSYCLNAPYDNLMEPGVHPREQWQRALTKGGLPHATFDEITGGEVVFHHSPKRLITRKPGEYSIYIVRDGRDVMVSYYYYLTKFRLIDAGMSIAAIQPLMKAIEPFLFSIFVARYSKRWAQDVRESISARPDQIVRYEELNKDPKGTLKGIFIEMGIDMDDAVIDSCIDLFSFERMSGRRKGEEDSASFFRKGIIGDWKEKFRERDKAIFKKFAGDALVELGYETHSDW